jgi:ribosome-associated protein
MDIKKLQRVIVDALEDVKAQDIEVYNTVKLSDMFERVIIASGTSNRQTRALAMSVREAVKTNGGDVISVEGQDTGEWVLVDCNDAIVHIMQPAIRQYYNLEELWGGNKVSMKLAAKKGLVKASEPDEEEDTSVDDMAAPVRSRAEKSAPKKAARKGTAKKAATGTKAPRKAAGKSVSKTAAPRKAPAKKRAAAK